MTRQDIVDALDWLKFRRYFVDCPPLVDMAIPPFHKPVVYGKKYLDWYSNVSYVCLIPLLLDGALN